MTGTIARTTIGRALISTVVLDFVPKDIDSYETMIFTDNDSIEYCKTHATLDEARQGHIQAIQYLLTEGESDDNNNQ
jgi:hypothetical protein